MRLLNILAEDAGGVNPPKAPSDEGYLRLQIFDLASRSYADLSAAGAALAAAEGEIGYRLPLRFR